MDPTGHVKDDAMIHIPLAASDAKYADLDGKHMKAIVRELTAISDKNRDSGEAFWGRNVGTQGHVDTENWVEQYFRKNNLQDIHRKSFDLSPQWIPSAGWSVTFSNNGKAFTLPSARPAHGMPATGPNGLTLDMAWGGLGTAADLAGKDVKGKAVLIQDILTPGVLNRWINNEGATARAASAGASAVGVVYGIADNFALWEGTRTGAGFNVGYEDGKKLRDMIGRGEKVTVTIKVQAETKSGLKTASVLGTLPGTTDENVFIIAHIDGYFEGALDNASGVAVMIESDGALREAPAVAAPPQHPVHGIGRPSRRTWNRVAPRGARHGAREDGAPHQPRTRRRRSHQVLGRSPPAKHRRVADAVVGVGQPEPARYLSRIVLALQRRHHRRHG